MPTRNGLTGIAVLCFLAGAALMVTPTVTRADDTRLSVKPAILRVDNTSVSSSSASSTLPVQAVTWRRYGFYGYPAPVWGPPVWGYYPPVYRPAIGVGVGYGPAFYTPYPAPMPYPVYGPTYGFPMYGYRYGW